MQGMSLGSARLSSRSALYQMHLTIPHKCGKLIRRFLQGIKCCEILLRTYVRSRRNHSIIVMSLVAVFALSNVGLPIVIASCHMSSTLAGSCPMCKVHSNSPEQQLAMRSDNSCCRTVIAAERNKTEFVQSQDQKRDLSVVSSAIAVLQPASLCPDLEQFFVVNLPVPRFSRDIPVTTSSLLI